MKTTLIKLTILLSSILLLTSCHQSSTEGFFPTRKYTPRELTTIWNSANKSTSLDTLAMLYADSLDFYGQRKSNAACIALKKDFLQKHKDYSQKIAKYLTTETGPDSTVHCYFIKSATLDGKKTDYPSYLTFEKKNGGWKIIAESDAITDRNLRVLAHTAPGDIPADAIKGDYDGDGKPEYLWVVRPEIDTAEIADCYGDCNCFIKCSNPKIPYIKIESCIDGTPKNYGDLDGDGTDEIGMLPGWFSSCWHQYYVYTFRHGKWIYAVEPFTLYCDSWDDPQIIRRDPKVKGNAIIKYYEQMEFDFKVREKSVKLN